MRITVRIPDDLFSAAESLAKSKGLNRSQLCAEALARYLVNEQESLAGEVANINAALDALAADPADAEEQAALALVHRVAARSAVSQLDGLANGVAIPRAPGRGVVDGLR